MSAQPKPYFDFRKHREPSQPLPVVEAPQEQVRLCAGGFAIVGLRLCDNQECWRCANEDQHIESKRRFAKLNP